MGGATESHGGKRGAKRIAIRDTIRGPSHMDGVNCQVDVNSKPPIGTTSTRGCYYLPIMENKHIGDVYGGPFVLGCSIAVVEYSYEDET